MNNMLEFLKYPIVTILCSGMFLLLYRFLVSRKASYTFCCRYLILAMVLSAIIPLLRVPIYSYHAVQQKAEGVLEDSSQTDVTATRNPVDMTARDYAVAIASLKEPATTLNTDSPTASGARLSRYTTEEKWHFAILALYISGILLFWVMITSSIVTIMHIRRQSVLVKKSRYVIAENKDVKSPFTFMHTIFVGRNYRESELQQIISHESSHALHHHSFQKLTLSILRSILWFNPMVWIAEKKLDEVQEWQADNDALSDGYRLEEYIDTIVRQMFGITPLATSGISNSYTKNRIFMMRQKESTGHNMSVFVAVATMVAGLFLCFGCVEKGPEYNYEAYHSFMKNGISQNESIECDTLISSEGRAMYVRSEYVLDDGTRVRRKRTSFRTDYENRVNGDGETVQMMEFPAGTFMVDSLFDSNGLLVNITQYNSDFSLTADSLFVINGQELSFRVPVSNEAWHSASASIEKKDYKYDRNGNPRLITGLLIQGGKERQTFRNVMKYSGNPQRISRKDTYGMSRISEGRLAIFPQTKEKYAYELDHQKQVLSETKITRSKDYYSESRTEYVRNDKGDILSEKELFRNNPSEPFSQSYHKINQYNYGQSAGSVVSHGEEHLNSGSIVSGKVVYKDENGVALNFANVLEVDADGNYVANVTTDSDGRFSFPIVNPKDSIIVSYIGCHQIKTAIESDHMTFIMTDFVLTEAH